MLYHLAPYLSQYWGPLRLFGSFLFLMIIGAGTAALAVWYILPRTWHLLPRDRGRAHAANAEQSAGKPTGAGFIYVMVTLPLLLLVLPTSLHSLSLTGVLLLAMLSGYGDDRSSNPWGEMKKGLLDLLVAFLAGLALCRGASVNIWIPLHKGVIVLSPAFFTAGATIILWITINATNCSDGVDGLAGTLTLLSIFYLGGFLYIIVGHKDLAKYLLVPHNPDGARWAVLLFTVAGALSGYIWHNAEPSSVLMGDAGSRFLGLLVGMAVLATGNPFLVLVVAPVVLVNGGTGLVKVGLLRVFRWLGFDISKNGDGDKGKSRRILLVSLLHKIRFPLHDHCRKNLHWSNSQVLVRFVLLQAFLTPLLMGVMVKVR